MRRATLLLFAVLALAAAVAAAGCGGGGGGKPLSKSAFIAKADGICTDANKNIPTPPAELKNVDPTAASATDAQLKTFGDYLDKLVKLYRSELGDLRKLKPPADLQDTWDRALATREETLNEGGEAAKAARDGNRAELKAARREPEALR